MKKLTYVTQKLLRRPRKLHTKHPTLPKLDDEFYKPRPQNYWTHNGTTWVAASSSAPPPPSPLPPRSSSSSSSKAETSTNPKSLRLFSWNIDMLQPNAEPRMAHAISHLHTLVTSTPPSTPVIIFLQELLPSDLAQLRSTPWIQRSFSMTELDDQRKWPSSLYGTTTLVDRRLQIRSVFRVPWISKFERDGLFVDVELRNRGDDAAAGMEECGNGKGGETVLRLCNTHLESLVADPPVRPLQLESASMYLRTSSSSNIAAAILAGDLNAIESFDRILHTTNNLHDLYLSLGGQEDSDDGYTWGYQVPEPVRQKFGCSRMDKILFRGEVRGVGFDRFGVGVVVEGSEGEEMKARGEDVWVTDHYGIMGDFEVAGSWELCVDVNGVGVESGVLKSKLT
ncbi:hypothetical protein DM02DRAFT_670575 [Periconia macrospinosa]|uniref:Endonuclease/exonuclease/phosphatase domain-containing protein n=1 Tax=Periconia macrospinosa TaxID=97972 RepID=A0A2V1DYK9_9PLEO|nr:hypothetical protein DM02DRAFT_670575 [Periconia macrospinosa]